MHPGVRKRGATIVRNAAACPVRTGIQQVSQARPKSGTALVHIKQPRRLSPAGRFAAREGAGEGGQLSFRLDDLSHIGLALPYAPSRGRFDEVVGCELA